MPAQARAARLWGWHRLEPRWAERIVTAARIHPGDLVLDLGAGTGALTAPLVAAGAHVVAFELHPQRAAELRTRFPTVRVVHTDVTDLRLPRRPFRVIANPPFAATTAILRRLLSPGSQLLDAHLLVPTGVARRWAHANPPGCNRWRRQFALTVGAPIPRHAYRPPPPMPTSLLTITRR